MLWDSSMLNTLVILTSLARGGQDDLHAVDVPCSRVSYPETLHELMPGPCLVLTLFQGLDTLHGLH